MTLRLPYSQETTPTVYPAYPKLQEQAYPWYPAIHSIQEGPRGQTTRLQDCIASQQRA